MNRLNVLSDRDSNPESADGDLDGHCAGQTSAGQTSAGQTSAGGTSDASSETRQFSEFRQYRAPRSHGETFIEPSLEEVPRLLGENIELLASQGSMFSTLRERARRQLIDDAVRYTSGYRDVSWIDLSDPIVSAEVASRPIIMAGHQPAIFHPGVWFKNFALSHLAKQTNAIAVNLVIDNDVAAGSSIRVPSLDPVTGIAAFTKVAYDHAGGGVPYEQTTIRDREMFDRFDVEVTKTIAPLVSEPCVKALWEHAREAIERCGVAGCALAQARHGLEGRIGLQTLELPLGVVCRTTAFAEFVLSILAELPRFHRCYNDAANQYRKAHGIRSTAHPVPNLTEDGEWFEAPLWIYGNDSPQRKPAWVRLSDDELILSDRAGRELRVDVRYPKLAAEQLAGLASPDFKLRPRALLTTMYARLVLSDLFLHGIGGGKYDQLGDMIMRSFFMVTPPEFMVISATIELPGVEAANYENEIRRLKRAIRDTQFQPERFAAQVSLDPELLERKRALLTKIPPKGERKAWRDQLEQINESLSTELDAIRESLRMELAQVQRRAASTAVLASREHPFCVFPLDYLTDTYRSLLDS